MRWGAPLIGSLGGKFGDGGDTRDKDEKKFHIGGTVSHVNSDSKT